MFTTTLTETHTVIDQITATIHDRITNIQQHGQNDGPDFDPYVLTAEDDDDDDEPPFSETPLTSTHQQRRSTAFSRNDLTGIYLL